MKTIFAVNSGSYSDYRINALFSKRELAEEFMSAVPDSEYNEIEEFVLDPPAADFIKRGYSVWSVRMLINGDTETATCTDNHLYHVEDVPHHRVWERTKIRSGHLKGLPDVLDSSVWAKTQKAAIKIVNEKRAQMIAMGEWQ